MRSLESGNAGGLDRPGRERRNPVLPVDRSQGVRELLQSAIEDGEWVGIEKRHTMPSNGRVFVIELDVTGSEVLMVGVSMEAKHQIPVRFDPVDAVVFVLDASVVPETNFQSCHRYFGGLTQERYRVDIRDDVPWPALRRAVPDVRTPSLPRQSVVYGPEESSLCIAVASCKKDHTV